MCPGPHACEEALEVRDQEGNLTSRERCDGCELDLLDSHLIRCPVFQRAIDIDFANQAGFRVTLDEVDVEEFDAIKVLRSERDKHQAEQIEKQSKTR